MRRPDESAHTNAMETSRGQALHSRLDDATTHTLLQNAKNCDIHRGEMLMRQGHPSAQAFMIESGGLLLFRTDQHGTQVALDLLGPGELCGIEDVLCDRPYALSARATTRTTCHAIPSNSIQTIINSNARAAITIAHYVAVRLRLAERHIEILSLVNTAHRIERVLRRLARQSGSRSGNDLRLPLTQGDLASLVGVSRQAVNRNLKDLKFRGVVTCHPGYIAVSEALLS